MQGQTSNTEVRKIDGPGRRYTKLAVRACLYAKPGVVDFNIPKIQSPFVPVRGLFWGLESIQQELRVEGSCRIHPETDIRLLKQYARKADFLSRNTEQVQTGNQFRNKEQRIPALIINTEIGEVHFIGKTESDSIKGNICPHPAEPLLSCPLQHLMLNGTDTQHQVHNGRDREQPQQGQNEYVS